MTIPINIGAKMPTRSDKVPLHYQTVLSAFVQGGTQESLDTVLTVKTELTTERLEATLTSNSIDDGTIPLPPSGAASTGNTLGVRKTPTASASAVVPFLVLED